MAFTLDYRQSGFSEQELNTAATPLASYLQYLIQSPEPFMQLSADAVSSPVQEVILIGIGGSSLGAAAVAQALGVNQRLFVVDVLDTQCFQDLRQHMETIHSQERTVKYIIASKSGSTLEIVANFSLFQSIAKQFDPAWKDRTVIITEQDSPLWKYADQEKISHAAVPKEVAGRFSIFTPMGLLPLASLGIDVAAFIRGAKNILSACLNNDLKSNPAAWSAAAAYLNVSKGRAIHTFFEFDKRLEGLGYFWRQLIAESLAKDHKGITPIVCTAADLHSMLQRYMDGPSDTYTIFAHAASDSGVSISSGLMEALAGKTIGELSTAIFDIVIGAFVSKQLPHGRIQFSAIDAESVGAFMMFLMMQTIFIAKLMGVNPFDQPGVEGYKQEINKKFGL